jgi:hypothetical protein
METTLLHITNPRSFLLTDVASFVLKALATSKIIPDAEAALMEIADYLYIQERGLFLTRDSSGFTGLLLVENSRSALSPGCLVLHFYNRPGKPESRKLLISALAAFAERGGQMKIRGFDQNQRPGAFARLFRVLGSAKPLGQGYEFDISRISA